MSQDTARRSISRDAVLDEIRHLLHKLYNKSRYLPEHLAVDSYLLGVERGIKLAKEDFLDSLLGRAVVMIPERERQLADGEAEGRGPNNS